MFRLRLTNARAAYRHSTPMDYYHLSFSISPRTRPRSYVIATLTAEQIKALLKLEPHPIEGGYFVQTYRSGIEIPKASLPAAYPSGRAIATGIYYLLTPDTFSAMHRLPGDEMFHFYLGDPVEMLQLKPDGTGEIIRLGQDIVSGMRLQHVVPGGVWQGSRLVAGGSYALLGTTMSPGFEYDDYETGSRAALSQQFPQFAANIAALTR
jgi:predicted cupin superfamily sugar epimerase